MEKQKKCQKFYFVIMRESRGGKMKLKAYFEEQFHKPHEGSTIKVFTFQEALKYFEIDDEVMDELDGIREIIENLDQNSAIFFDETPIVRSGVSLIQEATDWTELSEIDMTEIEKRNIFVAISFQPLLESVKKNSRPLKPRFPKNSSVLELNKVYRTSKSIFKCV